MNELNELDILYRIYLQTVNGGISCAAAADMLPKKEYEELETKVCEIGARAFAAGFRFATRLWSEGMR